jgi:hypothetical protein
VLQASHLIFSILYARTFVAIPEAEKGLAPGTSHKEEPRFRTEILGRDWWMGGSG